MANQLKPLDPETLAILSGAFDDACASLPKRLHTSQVRSALAECILKSAGTGERDQAKLRARAVTQILSHDTDKRTAS